ncbi:MAG: hypothetical protein QUS33_10165 [Dehalococcoidia bacterium]|nr:hypothetical protein [Dehalococcoidia bacterium]
MLGEIIAKALGLVNYVLDYFVVLTPTGITVGNAECGFECEVMNAEMTACGAGLIDNVMAITYGLVEVIPDLLCAVFFTV